MLRNVWLCSQCSAAHHVVKLHARQISVGHAVQTHNVKMELHGDALVLLEVHKTVLYLLESVLIDPRETNMWLHGCMGCSPWSQE